jgi:hypothetical protein
VINGGKRIGRTGSIPPIGIKRKNERIKMNQSKQMSLIESVTNVVIGFIISYGMSLIILPLFFQSVSHKAAFEITLLYTIASLIRSYVLRRMFNKIKNKEINAEKESL